MPYSEDEFDALPDDFADIDWTTVPELNEVPRSQPQPQSRPHEENNEEQENPTYDDLPDPFAGIDWNAVPALNASRTAANVPLPTVPEHEAHEQVLAHAPRPESARSSSDYSFDEVDDSFLLEVDALESNLTNQVASSYQIPPMASETHGVTSSIAESHGASSMPSSSATVLASSAVSPSGTDIPSNLSATTSSTHGHGVSADPATLAAISTTPKKSSKFFIQISPSKRVRSESPTSTAPTTPRKKSKKSKDKGKSREQADHFAGVRQALAGYEDELTCPICYDFLAASHLGNPCGHTTCGECGWNWISKHKRAPTCAICREKLMRDTPMIPNFAMDNTVERHIATLAVSGHTEWAVEGVKYKDWVQRKERWKSDAAKRAANARGAPAVGMSSQNIMNLINHQDALDADYSSDEDEDDEEEEDGSEDEKVAAGEARTQMGAEDVEAGEEDTVEMEVGMVRITGGEDALAAAEGEEAGEGGLEAEESRHECEPNRPAST
ncbi:hypothetical protein B0H21DRAFT_821698 [Amylocystis lapponica]|nr:hypothetical protein B0H21DRAFT_821698 [Amylocystis lapponica]